MSVVALIDRSRYAQSVCDHAVWIARELDTGIEVLHAIERLPQRAPADRSGRLGIDTPESLLHELTNIDEQQNRLAMEGGRLLLEDAASRLHAAGVEHVQQRLIHGSIVDHMRDHDSNARIVVMGARGEAEHRAPSHLGSNLERVIRGTHRPMLIASETFRPIERFLFAWDGGHSSGEAIHFLVGNPLLRGAEGQMLYAGEDSAHQRDRLATAAGHLRSAGISIEESIVKGDAGKAILETIAVVEPDLLVMGAYGHSRIRSLMVGSTTTEVMQKSGVSMLVFH